MITTELKKQIIVGMAKARENFTGSDAKFAVSLGINGTQYSRVKGGQTEKILSDAVWITIARKLGVNLTSVPDWKAANTPVFQFITAQLTALSTWKPVFTVVRPVGYWENILPCIMPNRIKTWCMWIVLKVKNETTTY